MRKLFFTIAIAGITFAGIAQEKKSTAPTYKIVGTEIVKVESAKQAVSDPEKTNLTHTIKGVKYSVYKSARGSYFIIRTSKKSGKEYKQYLKLD